MKFRTTSAKRIRSIKKIGINASVKLLILFLSITSKYYDVLIVTEENYHLKDTKIR